MELEKRKIYMNRQKARIVTQVTIDEDRNVPDVKPDMAVSYTHLTLPTIRLV